MCSFLTASSLTLEIQNMALGCDSASIPARTEPGFGFLSAATTVSWRPRIMVLLFTKATALL
jgi:hypothetical protein